MRKCIKCDCEISGTRRLFCKKCYRERRLESSRKWRNSEHGKIKSKEYYIRNKEEIVNKTNKYKKENWIGG